MSQVFLSEGHPEAGTFDCREVLGQTFQLFVVHQVRLFRADVRVVQRFVDGQRVCLLPFPVFEIFTPLGDLADIDFRIEVGCKCFVVVAGVAVHNIQVLDFIEMMFGRISRIYTCYTRIEPATEDCCQAGVFETFLVCPLPAVLVFGFVQRFVIGRVEITDAVCQAGIHDVEVLVRQSQVYH